MRFFEKKLKEARTMPEIFEVVKLAVVESLGMERGGLMLGLAELGAGRDFLLGAFYPVGSNIIVMNKTPLKRITETNPKLFKPYVFHILLHEYLHTLGFIDEQECQAYAFFISKELFGEDHITTRIAYNMKEFLPELSYPVYGWYPPNRFSVEIVDGFDHSNVSYIM
ncbi:MAG: hypothetical protein J4452_01000 [Candidatus Aenigmarchaeota archaeon]|nr:hypothetical protein [Candidatus Aenigmarchaeota archaeon]